MKSLIARPTHLVRPGVELSLIFNVHFNFLAVLRVVGAVGKRDILESREFGQQAQIAVEDIGRIVEQYLFKVVQAD